MIRYHHYNIHYEMIRVIWFVVIGNSEDHVETDVCIQEDDAADIHNDSGNLFLMVLNCKDYTSYIKHYNILTQKWL